MPYREEMKHLFKQVELGNRDNLEKVVGQLRKEFDTLHRICRLLMDDLDALDSKLTIHATSQPSESLTSDLIKSTHMLNDVVGKVTLHERRIHQIETLLMAAAFNQTAITVTNAGGSSTSVGGSVGNDINVNTEK